MNPFQQYTILALKERFVGRLQERRQIAELLDSQGNLALCGLPKIGKSSLVKQVLHQFNPGPTHLIFESDLSCFPSLSLLFVDLLERMKDELAPVVSQSLFTDYLPQRLDSLFMAWSYLGKILSRLHQIKYKLTWIIDEFDAIRTFADASQCVGSLRNFAVGQSVGRLQLIVISRRPLTLLEQQCGNSTLYNVCSHMELKPMIPEEWHAITARAQPSWALSKKELGELGELAGGHPFLTELLLCYAWPIQQLSAGNAHVLEYYEHLRAILTEDRLFDALLQYAVGPAWSLTQLQQERLLSYGLVQRFEQQNRTLITGWSLHFQTWLERQTRAMPIWQLLREVELGLRDLIEAVLSKSFGTSWLEEIRKRHPAVNAAMEGCEQRRVREKRLLGAAEGRELLDYSYIMDLWVIIQKEWQVFQKVFGNKSHKYWEQRIQQIVRVRNPEAHNRTHILLEYEINDGRAACQELSRILAEQLSLL